jgi:hypothetical protein
VARALKIPEDHRREQQGYADNSGKIGAMPPQAEVDHVHQKNERDEPERIVDAGENIRRVQHQAVHAEDVSDDVGGRKRTAEKKVVQNHERRQGAPVRRENAQQSAF